MKKLNSKKGFTLVELIVVIAIIIILAALAVPRVTKYVNDAREARRAQDFATMYTAVTAGYTDWKTIEGNELADGKTEIETVITTGEGDDATEEPAEADTLDGMIAEVIPADTVINGATDKENEYKVTFTADGNGSLASVEIVSNGYHTIDGGEVDPGLPTAPPAPPASK
ncbi:MAG: prepilin-type N-terminal cleavage/methylation domain-containing protein [Lachnospirales bacterium]